MRSWTFIARKSTSHWYVSVGIDETMDVKNVDHKNKNYVTEAFFI